MSECVSECEYEYECVCVRVCMCVYSIYLSCVCSDKVPQYIYCTILHTNSY